MLDRCAATARDWLVLLATQDTGRYAVGRLPTASKLSTTQDTLKNVTLVAQRRGQTAVNRAHWSQLKE